MKRIVFTLTAVCICCTVPAQTQKGMDIDGEALWDESGNSVSMPDANTVAIGAQVNDGNGSNSGHVRIYTWSGNVWVQKGTDIDGAAGNNRFGKSVSMPDEVTFAAGAYLNDASGQNAGHARIFTWNGSSWTQKGAAINGEAANDWSGWSVSMPDANTVAIGAHHNGGNGADAGHVRIYTWNVSAWVQKGTDIDGEAAGDGSGISVSMPDSNTVAIGAHGNDGSGPDAGHVRIYTWNGIAWMQKGGDIDGEAADDRSGSAVSMPDSNTVAIGAELNDGNGIDAGHARVYTWNGTAWTQKGADIDGESAGDRSGSSVSMPDANTVAIGAIFNDGNGIDAGHVRLFTWNGTAWTQKGADIDGEAAGDISGCSVSMPDTNTLAIGAVWNDGSATDAGHVRIYTYLSATTIQNIGASALRPFIFPNPTQGIVTIESAWKEPMTFTIYAIERKILLKGNLDASHPTVDLSPFPAGTYFLELASQEQVVYAEKIIRE